MCRRGKANFSLLLSSIVIVEVVRGVAPAAIHEAVERVVGLRPSRVATRGGGSGGAVAVRVGGGGRVALGDEKSSYER